MIKALGEAFDDNLTVSAIIVSESSMNTNTPGYDKNGLYLPESINKDMESNLDIQEKCDRRSQF